MHSNNNSDLATTVLSRKRVAMASVDSTNESFACLFDPYCLGMCSWTGFPGNADVAMSASWPHPELKRPPSCANEPHSSTATTSRFAFASEEELSKLAEGVMYTSQHSQNHSLGTKQLPTHAETELRKELNIDM